MNSELLLRSAQFDWQPAFTGWSLAAAGSALLLAFVLATVGYSKLPPRRRYLLLTLRFLGVVTVALV